MMRDSAVADVIRGMSLAVLLCVAGLHTTGAGEIRYASVKDVRGDDILTLYKGPGGYEYFVCNSRSLECESNGKRKPYLFPLILNKRNYARSADGRYALVETPSAGRRNKASRYELYTLGHSEPEILANLPFHEPASRTIFSPDGNTIVLFLTGGRIATYTIDSGAVASVTLARSKFPFRSLSYRGTYLASYDHADAAHVIWNIHTGKKVAIQGTEPGYVEFSADENHAAIPANINGFPGIRIADLDEFTHNITAEALPLRNTTVEDYIFIGNNLYYISNEASPYEWSIYKYDVRKKTKKVIAAEVSYNDNLRRMGGKLIYLKTEGKHTNIAIYDPLDNATSVLRPYPGSPLSPSIQRTAMSFGNSHGVLLSPRKKTRDPLPLFVWLHGGPKRQTSPAYHPYLSYAVYDELLDRIVLAESYVLKLDYPGSYGYGHEFSDSLRNNIGIIDVYSVIAAVEQLKKELESNEVYLIGNSYGGYLSLRTLVEMPDLFAGAISINGVYDWFTLIGQINSSPFTILFDGIPDLAGHHRNIDQYHAAGIYNRVSKIDDHKILLVLGEKDAMVPVWQTKEFFHVLNSLKKSVELVTFSDEGHILRKRDTLDKLCSRVLSLTSQSLNACVDGK